MDEENANPIVLDAIDSKRGASLFDAVPSTAVATAGALAAPAGASEAAAGGGQIPPEWNPYEEVSYISPSNPYDTCMDDPWNEVSGSDVGSDEEDQHTKARQVLRRLQVGATVNVYSFRTKHKALGIHLRNLQRVEIAVGRMPPIKPKVPKIKGQGSKNWRKSQMG
ncbi:hypothetical protein QYE76_059558 [Lolium multiflorum]|uniref:Uncharacterized protein n=1 Tax=Lolium multiflorum TaxID=4521 RepID=A0AAD8RYU3_LOLMU|nr:hypothetical protein QYE76_059558 [Lolium multiflorum]